MQKICIHPLVLFGFMVAIVAAFNAAIVGSGALALTGVVAGVVAIIIADVKKAEGCHCS